MSSAPGAEWPYDVVVVGGFGHIGLPLGILLADSGMRVALYDVDDSKRAAIESGRMPFMEAGAEERLGRVIGKSLHIAAGLEDAARSEFVIVTIGTPVDEYLNPKMMPMFNLAEGLLPHLRPGHHLMLRSTVYPGTTERISEFFARRGATPEISFCPERVVQGRAIDEIGRFPQIVSGVTASAAERAQHFFARLDVETVTVTVQEAELAKLFTNSWRYIEFAISNQFYMMATAHGADFGRIYHAMTHRYDRLRGFPRPGFAAGPCLLKDTLQLAAFHQNDFQLGHAAMWVNEGLPNFLVEDLRRQGVEIGASRIGILGMAFKADTDDIRDSLSYKLGKILRFHGATVLYSDEYVADPTFVSKEELLGRSDVVIIATPHSAYRGLRVPARVRLVDLWGIAAHEPPAPTGEAYR